MLFARLTQLLLDKSRHVSLTAEPFFQLAAFLPERVLFTAQLNLFQSRQMAQAQLKNGGGLQIRQTNLTDKRRFRVIFFAHNANNGINREVSR